MAKGRSIQKPVESPFSKSSGLEIDTVANCSELAPESRCIGGRKNVAVLQMQIAQLEQRTQTRSPKLRKLMRMTGLRNWGPSALGVKHREGVNS